MKSNKITVYNGHDTVMSNLRSLRQTNPTQDIVVLFENDKEIASFVKTTSSQLDVINLSAHGFSERDDSLIYVATPEAFLYHYNISVVRFSKPKFVQDMCFVAADIDHVLSTSALIGKVIPLDGLISNEQNKATLNLLNTTLNLLGSEALGDSPFYEDYYYDSLNGISFSNSFYDRCGEAWVNLNPNNPAFKDNLGFYQFLSIVMNFVEALHTSHPDKHYVIESGRVKWLSDFKVERYPLQQIIEHRHRLPMSNVEPVSVKSSLAALLINSGGIMVLSMRPSALPEPVKDIYSLICVDVLEHPKPKNSIPVDKYFISESVMQSSLISDYCNRDKGVEYVVYLADDMEYEEELKNEGITVISDKSSLDEYSNSEIPDSIRLVFFGAVDTPSQQEAIINRFRFISDNVQVERHFTSNSKCLNALSIEKRMVYLVGAQDDVNFIVRKHSKMKLRGIIESYHYDNSSVYSSSWVNESELVDNLHFHYDKIRRSVANVYDMETQDIQSVFTVHVDTDNLAVAKQLIHKRELSCIVASSSFRMALDVIDPINRSQAANVWNPNKVMAKSLI